MDSSTAPLDIAAAVTGPGPFGVGYHEDSVAYDAPDGPRALRLAVWYPTEATDGAATNYDGFFPATDVYSDATIAGGPFPVAVFSHGHQGYAENSGFLMEHLASHG